MLDLDLRKPADLERSHLLHRLNLLGIAWGRTRLLHCSPARMAAAALSTRSGT
jgi:hypothetical protein